MRSILSVTLYSLFSLTSSLPHPAVLSSQCCLSGDFKWALGTGWMSGWRKDIENIEFVHAVFKKQGFSIVFEVDETSSLSTRLMSWGVESGVLDKRHKVFLKCSNIPQYYTISHNILSQAAEVCALNHKVNLWCLGPTLNSFFSIGVRMSEFPKLWYAEKAILLVAAGNIWQYFVMYISLWYHQQTSNKQIGDNSVFDKYRDSAGFMKVNV